MPRSIAIMVLLIVIIFSGTFITLKIWSVGSEENYFNTTLRPKLTRFELFRDVLGLHFDGDARFQYLSDENSVLKINVYAMDQVVVDEGVVRDFQQKVNEITGKRSFINIESAAIPYAPTIPEEEQKVLAKKYVDSGRGPNLNILFLSQDESDPLLLGLTFEEDGIIIFDDAVRELTKENRGTFHSFELSTLLHEFGHQIGLSHNEVEGCLMAAHVELGSAFIIKPEDVVVDFCEYERQEIARIRSAF